MSDTPPSPAIARAHALAALVRGLLERPDDLSGHEALAQAMVAVPIESPIRLVPGPEGLEVDGAPTDVSVLATFLLSAGVEELGISSQVTAETLLSLARLMTSLPDGASQMEIEDRFRGLDTTTLQIRFRVRAVRPTAVLDRVSATEQLELPAAPSEEITAVLMQVEAISTIDPPDDELEWEAISRLIPIIELALKYGRDDELVDGLTALLVFEQGAQQDPRQVARRGAISQAIRKLTTPPLLQQLVSMRMASTDLPERAHLLQLILQRFKEDGVRAMFLRWAAAPTVLLRESVMQALKTMPRLHDTLDTVIRGTDELLARSAIAGLAELSDPRAEELLREHSRHPNEKVRRAALTALSRHSSDLALASLVAAVGDDVMIVRLCAVQALARPRSSMAVPRLTQLLEKERDATVLAAAIAALGKIGTAEAITTLERFAIGKVRGATPNLRIDACRALLAMRSPAAMVALNRVASEADRRVQIAASQLIAAAPRRTTTAIPAARG